MLHMSMSHDTGNPNVNLEQLETFLAVARLKSFTKAAPQVHRTQSAVSRQIQELERSLGVPLFERLGKQVLLTDAGRMLQHDAPLLLQQSETLRGRLRDIGQGVTGEIRIGATVTAANTFIPDVLAQFRRRYPDVRLNLFPGQSSRLVRRLRRNELDVAVLGSSVEEADLTTLLHVPDQIVMVASPDHPLTRKRSIRPEQLAGEELILRESGSDSRDLVERWFESQQVSIKMLMDLW
jgi:LysR family transcriptional regulator, low CO2-responsive transcriptional regulator